MRQGGFPAVHATHIMSASGGAVVESRALLKCTEPAQREFEVREKCLVCLGFLELY